MFDTMGVEINGLQTRIDKTLLEDRERRWTSDSQNSLREFYKTDVIPMSNSLYKRFKEIKEELIEEVQEMLNIFESMEKQVAEKSPKETILENEIYRLLEVSLTSEIRDCVLLTVEKQKNELLKDELEKSSNDSKDIQANLLKRIKILKNNFKRSQAQSIDFELKLQHQKEKMAYDVSWKSKLSTLNDENMLLKTQVDSVVQERENIKLEFQKLFNSIKATRSQNQKEVDELIENVNQKTYAYVDVRTQNQDLLMTIFELKNKLRTIKKGKIVNTKIDKFETLGKLVCVTPFNKTLENKAKNMSKLRFLQIGVESSNSVRRPKSKDTKSKNRVLKNTKSTSTYVWKTSSSASIDFNTCELKDSNVCQTNACVSNSKTVNITVYVPYSPDPYRISQRFPFIVSLTLKGFTFEFRRQGTCGKKITTWVKEIAVKFTCLKELHIRGLYVSFEDLETLTRTRGKDLRVLKISKCYGRRGDAFRYAVRLEDFSGAFYNEFESEDNVGFKLPPNMLRFGTYDLPVTLLTSLLPHGNQLRELHLKQGCTNLEYLKVNVKDMSNEAMECVGTHLKNLRKFRIISNKTYAKADKPLDNGIRAMLTGCNKLKRLYIILHHGELTDVGLGYIGKYGRNLKHLSLERIVESDAGLVELSKGCPKLRKLRMNNYPFC
ncbi:retrovirus-related pol polyprotein from transposon TNT 1-94 [Tanacetum coccineum]